MPQMVQLSTEHWFNLEEIVSVHAEQAVLVVVTKHSLTPLRLRGEKKARLLAWLAHQAQSWAVPMADNAPPF